MGINIEPYTYLEGKRVLRLLTEKIRYNKQFIKDMNLDPESCRPAIADDGGGVWDMISFRNNSNKKGNFTGYPHCTFSLSHRNQWAEAMITFPDKMERAAFKRLRNSSYEGFSQELKSVLSATQKNLRGTRGYKPIARIVQRHFKGMKLGILDGEMTVDLRACFGGKDTDMGLTIKAQEQWLQAFHALLANKRSNLQFQIGVQFSYKYCPELKTKNADELFTASFRSLRSFMGRIIEE